MDQLRRTKLGLVTIACVSEYIIVCQLLKGGKVALRPASGMGDFNYLEGLLSI